MKDILTGRSEAHLTKLLPSEKLVHKELAPAFNKLQLAAKDEGFDLQIISSFRAYEQQLHIWNNKAQGKRTLLDDKGEPLDFNKLNKEEVVKAIMRWSAVPGASRHHWGTDIDVFDANMLEASQVQLTPQEVAPDGPMGKLHQWLDKLIGNNESFGFFRPYAHDNGGVAPEMWHLSYAPVSVDYYNEYTLDVFIENLEGSDILLKEILLKDPKYYFETYVSNIIAPPF
jgi:LAS superfamily LD-carboxypeptidase LdcB